MIERDTAAADTSGLRSRTERSTPGSDHGEGKRLRSLLQRAIARGESIPQAIGLRIVLDLIEELQALAGSQQPARRAISESGLSPELIHVGADGRARVLDPQAGLMWQASSAAYTAPELIAGSGSADARSDVFALGVLLWEMLACRSLFGGASDSETRDHVLNAPIPRVQRDQFLRGEPIPAALAALVARALQRDPDQRFQHHEDFAAALRSAQSVAEHEAVAELVREAIRESAATAAAASAIAAADVTAQVDVTEILLSAARGGVGAEPTETSQALVSASDVAGPASSADDVDDGAELVPIGREAGERRRASGRVVVVAVLAVLAALGWIALRASDTPAATPRADRASAASSRAAPASSSDAPPEATTARPNAAPPRTADQTQAERRPSDRPGRAGELGDPAGAADATSPAAGKQGARKRAAPRGRARAAEFVPDDI